MPVDLEPVMPAAGFLAAFPVAGAQPNAMAIHIPSLTGPDVVARLTSVRRNGMRLSPPPAAMKPVLEGMGLDVVYQYPGVLHASDERTDGIGGALL